MPGPPGPIIRVPSSETALTSGFCLFLFLAEARAGGQLAVVTKPTAAVTMATPASTRIPLRLAFLMVGMGLLLPSVLSD